MLIIGIIIGMLVAGGLFGAYYFGTLKNSKPENQQATIIPVSSQTPTLSPTPKDKIADWKTYTNKTYGYSFKYPRDWNIDVSKAEPATANNAIASPDTSATSITKDGYTLIFVYNLSGVGGVSSVAARTEEITVDNHKFLKVYVNQETKPDCFAYQGIDPQTGQDLKPKQECSDYFNIIYLNNPSTKPGDNGASSLVDINGKTSTVGIELPALIKLDDPSFVKYNTIFNQILSTFKFTN